MPQPLLAIVGPTASGKTELALKLAREKNAELISVDSRQVYQFLSVGTAKPQGRWVDSAYIVEGIPIHLVDFLDPSQTFSASDFVKMAEAKIAEIRARGKEPIFVGGTGFYFRALTEGLAPLPPADAALRDALRRFADEHGRSALHKELALVDPSAAKKIPANNIARVMRALEVYRLTGKPISAWHQEHQTVTKPEWRLRYEGISRSKEELGKRIEQRCRTMIETGMIEETEALLKKKVPADSPALTGLGYPRITAYLQGQLTRDEMFLHLVRDTRHYAKRQMTWFRNQMEVVWRT